MLCLAPLDSAGHILGKCSHRDIKSMLIARHNKAVGLIQHAIASGPSGGSYMVMDASGHDATPDTVAATRLPPWLLPTMHAYARNCARIFSLLRVCVCTPALRSPPPLLLCPTCSAHAAYTLSQLVTAPIRPLAACKRTPLKNCNTSAFALRCGTLVGCLRNGPLRTLTCPLLAGTLSSCSVTLGPSLSRSQDTSSHFGCSRKMLAHSCMIYTTMQSRLLMQSSLYAVAWNTMRATMTPLDPPPDFSF